MWDRGKPSPALIDLLEQREDMLCPIAANGQRKKILVPVSGLPIYSSETGNLTPCRDVEKATMWSCLLYMASMLLGSRSHPRQFLLHSSMHKRSSKIHKHVISDLLGQTSLNEARHISFRVTSFNLKSRRGRNSNTSYSQKSANLSCSTPNFHAFLLRTEQKLPHSTLKMFTTWEDLVPALSDQACRVTAAQV